MASSVSIGAHLPPGSGFCRSAPDGVKALAPDVFAPLIKMRLPFQPLNL